MTVFTIRELIELAIGSPEPGHVNFVALQCLLHSFAEKMRILNDKVDLANYTNSAKIITNTQSNKSTTTAATKNETKSIKSSRQNSPRKRVSMVSVASTKQQCLLMQDIGAEVTSVHSNSSNECRSTKRRTAVISIIGSRFNIPSSVLANDRLSGGADEPTQEEQTIPATATEGENDKSAAEEHTAAEETEQSAAPVAASTEAAPDSIEAEAAPQTTPPPTEAVPSTATEEQVVTQAQAPVDVVAAETPATAPAPTEAMSAEPQQQSEPQFGNLALRLSQLQLPMNSLPEDLRLGIAIMKDQLDLAMEELGILTQLMMNNKIDAARIGQLRKIASRLHNIQRDNVYIEGTHRARFDEKSTSWLEGEAGVEMIDEEATEGEAEAEVEDEELDEMVVEKTTTPSATISEAEQDRYDLGLHVCYSQDKMLELLMDLKSEFCALTNKVNEIAAQLLKHDSQRMQAQLADLQDQMREFKLFMSMARDLFDRLENDRANNIRNFDEIRKDIELLKEQKIDRDEVEVLLSEKVDYQQLARKVNLEQLQQLQCRMERQFCEVNKLICLTERGLKTLIDELRAAQASGAMEEALKKLKETIDADICCVAQKLQKYIDLTNDDCAAAGARHKVLQDLSCISCDTECVMRTAERSKVPKLKSAHTTDTIAPLVTYELSSIRKSGIMGYIRKDEFPDSPSAWLQRQGTKAAMKMCAPRHAGGPHTTYTAKEHVEKVIQQKKC